MNHTDPAGAARGAVSPGLGSRMRKWRFGLLLLSLAIVSIVLAAVILLITILSISFYIWLNLTNPYRPPPSYWFDLYYGIRLFALLGFGVIALVAVLVWQIG